MAQRINEWWTLDSVANILGLSYSQVYRRVRKARPQTKRIGRSILVRVEDIKKAS